jgi:hypothetical protein
MIYPQKSSENLNQRSIIHRPHQCPRIKSLGLQLLLPDPGSGSNKNHYLTWSQKSTQILVSDCASMNRVIV